MQKLKTSKFNHGLRKDQPKLSLWRYAGLMLTYKCPAACEFCYYNCSPEKGGLMPVETAIEIWKSLIDLAGQHAEIHITGGEPFMYFDHLTEILAKAHALRLTGLDAIETNGYWAKNPETTKKRLEVLKKYGLKRLKISWDPFHAEFIDPECVKLLGAVGADVFGPENTLIRWDKYLNQDIASRATDPAARIQLIKDTLGDFPVRFTGRGANDLAARFAERSVDEIYGGNCKHAFLSTQGVHIDPYGNVFSGLCSGIVIGNVNETSLMKMWQEFDPPKCEFISGVYESSPTAHLDHAMGLGYEVRPAYAGKCHLCTDLRRFFFDKGLFKSAIAPADCYI